MAQTQVFTSTGNTAMVDLDDAMSEDSDTPEALKQLSCISFRDFVPSREHMFRKIPLARPPDQLKGIKTAWLLDLLMKTTFPKEDVQMWLGSHSSKDDIHRRVKTVTDYIDKGECKSDASDRLRCVVHMLKNEPAKHDPVKILLALAQNGAVCNVQKEIGIRSVYMSMTGTGCEEAAANSVETHLLTMLCSLREVLTEAQALSLCRRKYHGTNNSHYLIPIRNSYAEEIGLPHIPDVHASVRPTPAEKAAYLAEFMELYNTFQIMYTALEAVNEQPRKISNELMTNWFQQNAPPGVDPYEFLSEFVFNMSTGTITTKGILYCLSKLGILRGVIGVFRLSLTEDESRQEIIAERNRLFRLWEVWQENEALERHKLLLQEEAAIDTLKRSREYVEINGLTRKLNQMQHAKLVSFTRANRESRVKMIGTRMQKELKRVKTKGYPPGVVDMKQVVAESNLMWQMWVEGPEHSPYEGGFFHLVFELPLTYPSDPPQVTVKTRTSHPSVRSDGRLDVPILGSWHLSSHLVDVAAEFQALLVSPVYPSDWGADDIRFSESEARRLVMSEKSQ